MLSPLICFDSKDRFVAGKKEKKKIWLLKRGIVKTPATGIYCDRRPVAVSGRPRRETQQQWLMSESTAYGNTQKYLPALGALCSQPIWQFIHVAWPYSNAQCDNLSSDRYIAGDAWWCAHNSSRTGTMFGCIIYGTINTWLVDIVEEDVWQFY